MDLWAVHHVKNTTRTPVFLRNSFSEKPNSWNLGKPNSCSGADCKGKVFEIRVLRRRRISTSSSSSFAVRAMAKKNHENSGIGFSSSSFSFLLCLKFCWIFGSWDSLNWFRFWVCFGLIDACVFLLGLMVFDFCLRLTFLVLFAS